MDEDELRAWVCEQLGDDVPDSIWELLRVDGYLNVVDDSERDDLVRRVTQLLQVFSSKPMRKRRKNMTRSGEAPLKPVLTAYERKRSVVLSEYYAKFAATMHEVRRFRRENLKGQLLAKSDVLKLLDSHAARTIAIGAFDDLGIPMVHECEVLSEEGAAETSYSLRLRVTPPGIEVGFEFEAGDTFRDEAHGPQIVSVCVDGLRKETKAFRGSLLDELRTAGDALSAIPWRPGDATWFILTGEAPKFSPMWSNVSLTWGSFGGHGKVTLEIDPWVSAPSVATAYASAQRRLLGRHNRPISARRLELFRFVMKSADQDLEIPPWRGLMGQWNKKHRAWRYEDVRNFSRDFWAARRLLTFPDFIDFLKRSGVAKKAEGAT